MCSVEIKTKIVNYTKLILSQKHQQVEKQSLKDFKNTLSFSCPVCGDSHVKSKKRGTVYLDSMRYYCFNGDCEAKGWSLLRFFKEFNINLDNDFKDEIKKLSVYTQPKSTNLKNSSEFFEFLFKNSFNKAQIKKYYLLHEYTKYNWAYEFIISRCIPNYCVQDLLFRVNKFGNREVWILNRINECDGIIGIQIRNLDFDVKYTTKSYSTIKNDLLPELEIPENLQDKLETLSLLFNVFNVDLDNEIVIFEGRIDSFFVKNSISTSGASKLKDFFIGFDNIKFFFDNDSTGKKYAIDKIKQGSKVFLWSKFFKVNKIKNKRIKDLNDLIIENKKENLNCLNNLKDFFSNSKLDIWNI